MLLFRGPHWDRGLTHGRTPTGHGQSDGVVRGTERTRQDQRRRNRSAAQGRIISGTNGRFVRGRAFCTESKEAVGGYLVLQADNLNEAVEIAQVDANVALRHQR